MPTLNWIGKEAVVKHHKDVPYRLLEPVLELSCCRIGDFDSKEEFECAVELDKLAQQGRINFWVRNLVRKEGCSFFLQKADGQFYPDFLCQLPNGVVLAVGYKGADRLGNAEDDRLIGGLWEELSGGRCRF